MWHLRRGLVYVGQTVKPLTVNGVLGPPNLGFVEMQFRTAIFCMLALPLSGPAPAAEQNSPTGWVQLFNGKTLDGWKTHPQNPGKWRVEDGVLIGDGKAVSHLFTVRGDYQDFQFRIEAKISSQGNSGQLFRATFAPGYPPGYEAQINSDSLIDPVRTGSLYPAFDQKLTADQRRTLIVTDQLHKPNEWFTQEVTVQGNHIIIKVNGRTTVDFIDQNNIYSKGHLALQIHGASADQPETVLHVKKAEMRELPPVQ